jgi:hypothetical protein
MVQGLGPAILQVAKAGPDLVAEVLPGLFAQFDVRRISQAGTGTDTGVTEAPGRVHLV